MITTLVNLPAFHHAQPVSFVGGKGIVQSYRAEAGSWLYLVKMSWGQEPEFGRVGAETMVVLLEADLHAA